MKVAVIGGGVAGLSAAEAAAAGGAEVTIYEQKASVGRKLLVAGRGGLNLTHDEPRADFIAKYLGGAEWASLIEECDAAALRRWAAGLGVETFVASTGRVYPREMKAAPLLRRWVERLRHTGVQFAVRHRWSGWQPAPSGRWVMSFDTPAGEVLVKADAAVLCLGGASWPETGSDGRWVEQLRSHGIEAAPLEPANCGWEIDWPAELLAHEGTPLKNVAAQAGAATAQGELMITRYGLEGGVIYALGAALRAMPQPLLAIDLKPASSAEQLVRKLGTAQCHLIREGAARWRLSDAAAALLAWSTRKTTPATREEAAQAAKHCFVPLRSPRPIAEAISSAGGVRWSELDTSLMLRRLPGIFVAGEMIDWEAPTGGYLIQGCFAMGLRAGSAAARHRISDSQAASRVL